MWEGDWDVDLPQMHSALLPQQVEGLDAIAVVVVVVVLDCCWEGESGSEVNVIQRLTSGRIELC